MIAMNRVKMVAIAPNTVKYYEVTSLWYSKLSSMQILDQSDEVFTVDVSHITIDTQEAQGESDDEMKKGRSNECHVTFKISNYLFMLIHPGACINHELGDFDWE
jgi:hypothetical protein